MKILFCIHKRNRLRNFTGVIRRFAELGHTVRLAFLRRKPTLDLPEELRRSRGVSPIVSPKGRTDRWGPLAAFSRSGLDYLRYFDPGYEDCDGIKARAFRSLPEKGRVFFRDDAVVRSRVREMREVLSWMERRIPVDPVVEDFLRRESPDVLLVSPLVQAGSRYQVDHVKAAHALGIPVAFLPFSWDNLTNKGLMRILPDKVFVWNETQRKEAVEMHGVPGDMVAVCGAWRFDDFFAMKPASTREAFCARTGLDPARPFINYLCSSNFTAPGEAEFVTRWIREIRSSPDPVLRTCGVLIRPYPDMKKSLEAADLSGFENVALWRFDWPALEGHQGLYDSLHHGAAAVGINTSAMIEAGILEKPVHTIIMPEFHGGQAGTRHFHYFSTVGGGLLEAARDFEEHRRLLSESLADGRKGAARSRRFTEAFLRPLGIGREATPGVVDAVLAFAALGKKPREAVLGAPPPKEAFDFLFEDDGFGRLLDLVHAGDGPGRPVEGEPCAAGGEPGRWLQRGFNRGARLFRRVWPGKPVKA